MESFKIQNYEREHGAGTFFSFQHLSDSEATAVRERLKTALHLPKNSSPLELVEFISDKGTIADSFNVRDESFSMYEFAKHFNIVLSEYTFVNWYRFDDIDLMTVNDLFSSIDDIWYPSVDEIDILDSEMRWILSIDDAGGLKLLELQ